MIVIAWCLGAIITVLTIMRLLGFPVYLPGAILTWIFRAIKLGLMVLIIEHHIVNAHGPSTGRIIIVALVLWVFLALTSETD